MNDYPIIDDSTSNDILFPPGCGTGYVERDYSLYPEEMYQQPSEMELIPESEWDARFEEQEQQKSSLEHLYLGDDMKSPQFVNLDQNGDGYCWSYSVGHCIMIERMATNSPNPRINPHCVAAIIKNGRDEGGWCGLSQQAYKEKGCALEGTGPGQWPLHSRNLSYNTPDMQIAAMLNRCTEDWVDLTKPYHARNLNIRQVATQLFNNRPCAMDFQWWGHSVCAIRFVRIERGSWGILILNSWKNWGRYGLSLIQGEKIYPMGAVGIRSTTRRAA